MFNALDLMENKTFLEKLKFGIGDGNLQYYLYNWKCPSMGAEKVRPCPVQLGSGGSCCRQRWGHGSEPQQWQGPHSPSAAGVRVAEGTGSRATQKQEACLQLFSPRGEPPQQGTGDHLRELQVQLPALGQEGSSLRI